MTTTTTTCEEVLATPVDPISAALMEISLDDVVCCRSELTDPWAMEIPVEPGQLLFHIAVAGDLLAAGRRPRDDDRARPLRARDRAWRASAV